MRVQIIRKKNLFRIKYIPYSKYILCLLTSSHFFHRIKLIFVKLTILGCSQCCSVCSKTSAVSGSCAYDGGCCGCNACSFCGGCCQYSWNPWPFWGCVTNYGCNSPIYDCSTIWEHGMAITASGAQDDFISILKPYICQYGS